MSDSKKEFQDPKLILQRAIEQLNVFTQNETSRLEVGENGCLIAAKETRLERVVNLARSYIGPFFSEQVRQNQEKKLTELKQAVLQARDIIKSHSALIEKFKEGDDGQKSLASCALVAIQRYNAIVVKESSTSTFKQEFNYERECLLHDQEIKGQPIELPHTVSIKFDSHPDAHPAKKMLRELSQTLFLEKARNSNLPSGSTHKKTIQFMVDTFRMKAIRMIQTHLSQKHEIAEILLLVKQAVLEIDGESNPELISMRQLIEIGPGTFILISGSFKRNTSDSKFLSMPLLDSFRLSFQLTHTGFPYASQHTGWALADKWVEASPLRTDQVPLFQQLDQKRKWLAHQLLFNDSMIQKTRQRAKIKRQIFDQNKEEFLALHRQMQQFLIEDSESQSHFVFNEFYHQLNQVSSPFDILVQSHQQLLDLFIRDPIKILEEEWLGAERTPLRFGSPVERFHSACQKLEFLRNKAVEKLDPTNHYHGYIQQQGLFLGAAFQSIGLQYQSEKMGFSPPLLNDVERKLQVCAFQQLLAFIDECENRLEILNPLQIKNDLLSAWQKDLEVIQAATVEDTLSPIVKIIDELEVYFNWRFFSFYPHR